MSTPSTAASSKYPSTNSQLSWPSWTPPLTELNRFLLELAICLSLVLLMAGCLAEMASCSSVQVASWDLLAMFPKNSTIQWRIAESSSRTWTNSISRLPKLRQAYLTKIFCYSRTTFHTASVIQAHEHHHNTASVAVFFLLISPRNEKYSVLNCGKSEIYKKKTYAVIIASHQPVQGNGVVDLPVLLLLCLMFFWPASPMINLNKIKNLKNFSQLFNRLGSDL